MTQPGILDILATYAWIDLDLIVTYVQGVLSWLGLQ